MNYYELLEVSPRASPAVIRAAYKSLMQRYHPDKHPDDRSVADMATLVVQAFEVLSDEQRRAAYDQKLKRDEREREARRRAVRPGGRPESAATGRSNAAIALLFAAALLVLLVWLLGATPRQSAAPATLEADVARAAPAAPGARQVPKLLTDVAVTLHERDADGRSRVLLIPSFGVRVGPRDAENAIRHLRHAAGPIRDRLEKDLAAARFDRLIQPDGDRYLAQLILGALCAAAAAPVASGSAADAAASEPCDAVDVTLPQSFSVK